ncbi:apolipoprotein D-like [Eurosta solidaginis]|uniref:apolipoprotein D-like n=1 Tax=Eurosta solidaginis TaxID=178769 RepID=UPI003530FF91
MLNQQFEKVFLSLIILLTSSSLIAGQVVRTGNCPTVTTLQDFDLTKYLGVWNEFGKYPFAFESGTHCVTAEYGALGNNQISVVNTQHDSNTLVYGTNSVNIPLLSNLALTASQRNMALLAIIKFR